MRAARSRDGRLVHVHVHVGYGEWMSKLLRWSLRHADALVAISEFVAQSLVSSGHDSTKTYVVLNAIDPAVWEAGVDREAARRELGLPRKAPVVLTVCRLFPEKGPGTLLRVVAEVRKVVPDTMLVVVGEDVTPGQGYSRELRRLACELGMDNHVVFAGRRRDVARMMAAADVFAMPSLEEPFGLVFLEAMAMGLPVIALASGGVPEVIEHARSGLLSPPGDLADLVENTLALISDPERRRRMGEHGRRLVEARFAIEHMARDTATIYQLVGGALPVAPHDARHDTGGPRRVSFVPR